MQKDRSLHSRWNITKWCKPLLGGLALILICRAIDAPALADIFKRVQFRYFILFMLISYPMIWASAMKWAMFLPSHVFRPSIFEMMKMYTVSYFANLFLPSSIGGDAVRSLALGKHISDNATALLATFYEKYTGLITLIFVSLLGSIFGTFSTIELTLVNAAVFVLAVVIFVVMIKGYGATFARGMIHKIPLPQKLKSIADKLLSKRLDYIMSWKILGKVFLLSLLFYVLTVLNVSIGLRVIQCDSVSFFDLMCVVPIILFVSMLPLTPGGIGVQEGAFMYFLTTIGIPAEDGLALAILLRIKSFVLAGLGWYFYVQGSTHKSSR